MTKFELALQELINIHNKEENSNTPDFILARYMVNCLAAFNVATKEREEWYSRHEVADGVVEGDLPADPRRSEPPHHG